MIIKKGLSDWITAAMALVCRIDDAFGNTKAVKAPRKPKIPKTRTDYEAMHAAEMKRRRKTETRLHNQHNQEA